MSDERSTDEWCRECRDEQPFGAPGVPADFILWGKFFPPEAFGPRCYDHAAKHIGWSGMAQIDQWAVYDLRPVRSLRGVVQAAESERDALRSNVIDVIASFYDGAIRNMNEFIRQLRAALAAAADAPQPTCPAGICARPEGHAGPHTDRPSPAVLPDRKASE